MFTIDLTGKTAIITGAGNGLARQCALSIADCGANIVVADIDPAAAKATAAEVEKMGPKALAQQCDVTDFASMEALFDAAVKTFGKIDIVINGAGIGPMSNVEFTGEADFRKIIDINLVGTEFGCKLALRHMKEQKSGVVINFASVAAFIASQTNPHYAAVKAAVYSLTKQFAIYAAPMGIRFNSICPGIIRTAIWERGLDEMSARIGVDKEIIWKEKITAVIPMGTPQDPEDIADAVVFLVSDQARYITGQALNVDGGQVMH